MVWRLSLPLLFGKPKMLLYFLARTTLELFCLGSDLANEPIDLELVFLLSIESLWETFFKIASLARSCPDLYSPIADAKLPEP